MMPGGLWPAPIDATRLRAGFWRLPLDAPGVGYLVQRNPPALAGVQQPRFGDVYVDVDMGDVYAAYQSPWSTAAWVQLGPFRVKAEPPVTAPLSQLYPVSYRAWFPDVPPGTFDGGASVSGASPTGVFDCSVAFRVKHLGTTDSFLRVAVTRENCKDSRLMRPFGAAFGW